MAADFNAIVDVARERLSVPSAKVVSEGLVPVPIPDIIGCADVRLIRDSSLQGRIVFASQRNGSS